MNVEGPLQAGLLFRDEYRAPDAAQRVALREAVRCRAGAHLQTPALWVPALRSSVKNAASRVRDTCEISMAPPASLSFASHAADAARVAELRRVKALATLVLAGTLT